MTNDASPPRRVRATTVMDDAKSAATALAALHTWAAIVAILESGASPGRVSTQEEREVQRVVQIANAAKNRMLKMYDKALEKI